jgi:maleylacetate reductase
MASSHRRGRVTMVAFPAWPAYVDLHAAIGTDLAKQITRIGAARPFVIASTSLAHSGALDALGCDRKDIRVGMGQHAPQPDILAAAAAARERGADAIVSIGGGSIVDAAKLICVVLGEGIDDLRGLAAFRGARGGRPLRAIPHIAVPTTLSGAEFTWFAGARNPATGLKEAFAARSMIPSVILFDQALACRTPLSLWLSTGLRAIDHAVETLLADSLNPFAETLCREGIARMLPALEAAACGPDDSVAERGAAQTAAWFCAAGLMSGVPMGASHAVGHVIGSLFDVPHGLTSCVMLPAVIAFNGVHVPERLARLRDVIGDDPASELRRRIAALGLPTNLGEIGIGPDKIAAIVAGLADEPWLSSNPRPIRARADIETLLGLAE